MEIPNFKNTLELWEWYLTQKQQEIKNLLDKIKPNNQICFCIDIENSKAYSYASISIKLKNREFYFTLDPTLNIEPGESTLELAACHLGKSLFDIKSNKNEILTNEVFLRELVSFLEEKISSENFKKIVFKEYL